MTALPPNGLLCECLALPERTRTNTATPRFGWVVRDSAAGAMQMAYQILVASSLEVLAEDRGDLWDSGAVDLAALWGTDARSLHIPYAGSPLAAGTTYHWKVRTWNTPGEVSPFSEPQTFHIGELTDTPDFARYPVEQFAVAPADMAQLAPGRYFIDFGKAAFATLQLRLTGPGEVQIALGEVLSAPMTINANPGGSRRYYATTLALQPGTHTYTLEFPPYHPRANSIDMPAEIGEVLPFRYAELSGVPGALLRDDVRQLVASYPFNSDAVRFTSSSRVLNDVWEMCRYTMQATSFCGVYIDGDRERLPYEGDAYINQLGHYHCDREFSLARTTFAYLAEHTTWPTEWQLYMLFIAWADYQHTGDASLIARYYDLLCVKSLMALAREDGLISVSTGLVTPELLAALRLDALRDVIDWPQCERDGFDERPINTVVNAVHYQAVCDLAEIAAVLGKTEDAARFRQHAARVKATMQALLIDADSGLFVDGEGSAHHSQHANAFPLAFGLVPPENISAVLAFVQSRGMACSVYAAQFLLEGLYRAGAADAALALLTSRTERSWAHMIYDVGTTIALEAWDDRFKPNQDWNHAWGAAPANLIPRWLMGVRPLEPGFAKILIHPQPGSLRYAEMTLPTIRGAVTVRVEHEPGQWMSLEVDIPANTSARVVLPRLGSDSPTVLLDSVPTVGQLDEQNVIIDALPSGQHRLYRGAV